jgi:hypothetical protein
LSFAFGLELPLGFTFGLELPLGFAFGLELPVSFAFGLELPLSFASGLELPLSFAFGLELPLSFAFGPRTAYELCLFCLQIFLPLVVILWSSVKFICLDRHLSIIVSLHLGISITV